MPARRGSQILNPNKAPRRCLRSHSWMVAQPDVSRFLSDPTNYPSNSSVVVTSASHVVTVVPSGDLDYELERSIGYIYLGFSTLEPEARHQRGRACPQQTCCPEGVSVRRRGCWNVGGALA